MFDYSSFIHVVHLSQRMYHLDACVQNIHVTAYSPLGTPPSSAMFKDYQPDLVMNDPVVKDMAKKYNKNVGQVCSFDIVLGLAKSPLMG